MEKIGFIGLGDMGGPLARNLKRSGADMIVYDINPDAVKRLTDMGAEGASSVAEVAKASDIVITVLPASAHVKAVVLGPDGVMENAREGTLVMDMSTIDPATTDELAKALVESGLAFVDSPIGRTVEFAEKGESLFMVGASSNDFGRVKPSLEGMGSIIHHCGAPGTGIRTKLINNFLAVSQNQLSAEAMTLATAFGLDLEQTLKVVTGTTATNGALTLGWPNKAFSGDIEPGFKIDLALKDMNLVMESARQLNLPLMTGATVKECLTVASRGLGFGDKDFSGLLDAQCKMVGIDPPRLKK